MGIFPVLKPRRMKWTVLIARMGDRRGVCTVLVGKPDGKRPLGRPRNKYEFNINPLAPEISF